MRVDQLAFDHELALYRGDGTGAAVVRSAGDLPAWARVEQPGAGIPSGYLYLTVHSSEIEVHTVAGDADAERPGHVDQDARLTPLGAYFDAPDHSAAVAQDAELAAKTQASMARIHRETFTVHGETPWGPATVVVGPTAAGETRLQCRTADGELRLLTSIAPRHALEGARAAAVTITVGYRTPRRLLGGMASRTARITLSPLPAEPLPAE